LSKLMSDYAALPDVVFAREHWLAILVYIAFCAGVMLWSSLRARPKKGKS
jgi:hypothetical protein